MTKTYQSVSEIRADLTNLPQADVVAEAAARARDAVLTKPLGALGRLEAISSWYASWRQDASPVISHPQVVVFAGNHGVTAKGVSAFPTEVTVQMVENFKAGGAAINQLAQLSGAAFGVVPIRLDTPTGDFTQTVAMNDAAFLEAFNIGAQSVAQHTDILVLGEMGIGNTTSAAALLARVFEGHPADWAGAGTGLSDDGIATKAAVIAQGLALHTDAQGLDALAALGGREIVAMAGAMLSARMHRIPVVLDGFIATSAAASLWSEEPRILDHMLAGHLSDEQAHGRALEALGLQPVLDLGLRLGEGSGAAVALLVVKAALACHSGMATFAEAGVSDSG
ncbi:MAG: nicotinate-nucleotide--dimethylbenzimidazole phosphoribosyltransferase [Pseudomonadota bacterium]